nr:hypothetical protein [Tanacetum cinerariifolium]
MGLWDSQTMIHFSLFFFFLGGLATLSFYTYNNQEAVIRNVKVALANTTTSAVTNTSTRVFGQPTRKDVKYLQWRWQPHSCNFPKFNGKALIERLRGKRILFVGDSLNRNQWISMICMLNSLIPGVKNAGGVESIGDNPTNHHRDDRLVVAIKSIEKHARHWVDADVLVFNSYHWWRLPVVKLLKSIGSSLEDPNIEFEEVDSLRAYKMGLRTWSKWAQTHIDPLKTKLYFMGVTATHSRAKEWGGKNHANCYGETEPVMDDRFWERRTDPQMLSVLESSLRKLKAK